MRSSRNRRVGIDDNASQTWVVYDGSHAYADFNGSVRDVVAFGQRNAMGTISERVVD